MNVRSLYLILVLLCVTSSMLATEYYPQRARLIKREDFTEQRFVYVDSVEHSDSYLSWSVNDGILHLNIKQGTELRTQQMAADSVVAAHRVALVWFAYIAKNDSLWCMVIPPHGPPHLDFLFRTPEFRILSSEHGECCLSNGDNLSFITSDAVAERAVLHNVEGRNRRITYARRVQDQWLLASVLSSDVLSIELIGSNRTQNVGVLRAMDGLVVASERMISGLSMNNGLAELQSIQLRSTSGAQSRVCTIPPDFYEALALSIQQDTTTVIFANGCVRVVGQQIVLADHCSLRALSPGVRIDYSGTLLILNDNFHQIDLEIRSDPWFRFRVIVQMMQDYGLWLVAILGLLYFIIRSQRYRRQLRDVIEHGVNGISFVVDSNSRLRRINTRARELFEMDATTPLSRVLRFYCHGESQRIVESFVSSAIAVRGAQTQKLMFKSADGDKEIIFTAQPLRSLTGGFDGLLVTGVDITEELERKRLVNWAQLAHDMQTNLSIIKLNAQQLSDAIRPDREEQRLRIVHQASLLLQRVRDIVSIGRDEQLHLSELDLRALCQEVVKEFDDASFSHIRFVTPERSMIARIDKAKMLRALRNAVENAIRALHEQAGDIVFDYSQSKSQLVLSIRDSGVGMDEQTLNNFFRPYFSNYRQFGGTGIGTMIMQRAIQIHGGTIEVRTAPGAGTTIMFNLPSSLYVRG